MSVRRDDDESPCTCWWGCYIKIGGGTGFDIVKNDPDCPEHGEHTFECIDCDEAIAPALARLGSTRCHDCR